jgi:fatty-acyl-CoA synthase
LAALVFEQAERHGQRPAVICDDRVVSYAELARRAACVATALRSRGFERGDRVGLLMNNRVEWLEAFFGAAIAGAVVVAFSTWSSRDELDWLLRDSAVQLLIALDRFGDSNFAADLRALVPEAVTQDVWQSARYPALRDIILLGHTSDAAFQSYDAFATAEPAPCLATGEAPGATDDAIIIYTSGSSSRPKSVPLSHLGIIENGFNIGERQGYRPHDRVLLVPPLFWSYGSANAMSATLTHGAALVLQGKFDPGEAIALIERHRCTALYTLPAITSAIVSHPTFRPERVGSLRTGLTIGAPQDVLVAAQVLGASEICNVYGQTESYGNCQFEWF